MRRFGFRKKLTAAISMILLTLSVVPAQPAKAAYTSEALADASAIDVPVQFRQNDARNMLAMINELRTNPEKAWALTESGAKRNYSGLKALSYDYTLEEIAMQRAVEAAVRWDHLRPSGNYVFALLTEKGYRCSVGENLAAGSANAANAFNVLCEENKNYAGQGHRRNMLSDKYTAVGIGHVIVNGTHYWAQVFGGLNLQPTVTPANNNDCIVTVQGSNGYFKNIVLEAASNSVTMAAGSSLGLPAVSARFAHSAIWPSGSMKISPCISWTSSNPSVAQVQGNNIVSGKAGSAVITGTMMGGNVRIDVTVTGVQGGAETPKPAKATGFRARSHTLGVTIEWNPVPNADGYIIYSRVGNSGSFSYKYVVTKTNFTDLKASADSWNFYMVFPYTFNEKGSRVVNTQSDYVYGKMVRK